MSLDRTKSFAFTAHPLEAACLLLPQTLVCVRYTNDVQKPYVWRR